MNAERDLPLTDAECAAFRALPESFNDMLRAVFRAGRQRAELELHPLHMAILAKHGELETRIAALEVELMAATSGADQEAKQADHWKANHENMVARCALLSQRDDLPVDRLPAYRELVRLQALVGMLDAGPWRYHAEPHKDGHDVYRYFIESDSGPDVRLYINGNFADDAERRLYGEALAARLNAPIGDL